MIFRRFYARLAKSEDLSIRKFIPALILAIVSFAFAGIFYAIEKTSPDPDNCKSFDFWTSVYFIGTIYTTIGYGNVGPCTSWGKVVSVIVAVLGIPLAVVVLDNLGQIFAALANIVWVELHCCCCCFTILFRRRHKIFARFGKKPGQDGDDTDIIISNMNPDDVESGGKMEMIEEKKQKWSMFGAKKKRSEVVRVPRSQDNMKNFKRSNARSLNLPVWIGLIVCVAWIFISAGFFMATEGWDLGDSIYFMLISVTTVGFGDVAPKTPSKAIVIPQMGFLIIGLALFSMCINLVEISLDQLSERLIDRIADDYKRKLEESGETVKELTAQEAEKEVDAMLKSEARFSRFLLGKKARRDLLDKYGKSSRMRIARTQTETLSVHADTQTEQGQLISKASQAIEKELKLNARGWYVRGQSPVKKRMIAKIEKVEEEKQVKADASVVEEEKDPDGQAEEGTDSRGGKGALSEGLGVLGKLGGNIWNKFGGSKKDDSSEEPATLDSAPGSAEDPRPAGPERSPTGSSGSGASGTFKRKKLPPISAKAQSLPRTKPDRSVTAKTTKSKAPLKSAKERKSRSKERSVTAKTTKSKAPLKSAKPGRKSRSKGSPGKSARKRGNSMPDLPDDGNRKSGNSSGKSSRNTSKSARTVKTAKSIRRAKSETDVSKSRGKTARDKSVKSGGAPNVPNYAEPHAKSARQKSSSQPDISSSGMLAKSAKSRKPLKSAKTGDASLKRTKSSGDFSSGKSSNGGRKKSYKPKKNKELTPSLTKEEQESLNVLAPSFTPDTALTDISDASTSFVLDNNSPRLG